eukprot:3856440-Pyramimonas_sp.AAC.1
MMLLKVFLFRTKESTQVPSSVPSSPRTVLLRAAAVRPDDAEDVDRVQLLHDRHHRRGAAPQLPHRRHLRKKSQTILRCAPTPQYGRDGQHDAGGLGANTNEYE